MKVTDFLKKKKVLIILMIASVLSVFCAVKMVMPKQQYHYSGEVRFDDGVAVTEAVLYEQISLPAGVYDVKLSYQSDTSMTNWCTAKDGTVFTGGLLTNGENLHAQLDTTEFRVYLFENTESLEICMSYGGQGTLIAGDLDICETNTLWTMLLTIIWSVVVLLLGILAFREYDNKVGVERERKNVIASLAIVVLISSLPYLLGGCVDGADLVYHLQRIEGVKEGILTGQFPVRIEPRWLFDHGYANGIFYCNTLLYFPALLRMLGFTVTTSYNLYCIALNIATACISYYCFSRIFKNRYIGLLCSSLYTLSIFRIYKLIITAALGEGSAVTFMPLVFYGFYRAFSEDVKSKKYKTVWIPIAIGYAGLIQTHVLSCEITAFLTIVICLVYLKKIFVKETFMELAKGALSALAMSCWYLVPFLDYYMNEDMHIRHVSARTIQNRGLYLPQLLFHWWKLGDNAVSGDMGMVESHAMGVGLILAVAFCVFCILWFSGKLRKESVCEITETDTKETTYFMKIVSAGKLSCIVGGMLMLMSLNVFPWDWIQNINSVTASLVSSLQFPNRFLGWGTVFLVVVSGCLLWYFKKSDKKWCFYISVICVLIGITTSSLYLLDYVCRDKRLLYIYSHEGMGYGYISGAEYLVEGTNQEQLGFSVPSSGENVTIFSYEKGALQMKVNCENAGSEEGYIELPLLHYTGYKAYVTTTEEELATQKGTNNLVRVTIPAGFQGEIAVKFVSPIHWRISEVITYCWWIFIIIFYGKKFRKHQRGKERKE